MYCSHIPRVDKEEHKKADILPPSPRKILSTGTLFLHNSSHLIRIFHLRVWLDQMSQTVVVGFGKTPWVGTFTWGCEPYNFLVTEEGVKLPDFESSQENPSRESMQKKLDSLRLELTEDSGRGGGFTVQGDGD